MKLNLNRELAALKKMTTQQLQQRFAELFGDATPTRNRTWLTRRIVWRLQALEEGDLSERAKRRADELANDADLRVTAPTRLPIEPDAEQTITRSWSHPSDERLPTPGTVLKRVYKGQTLQVLVLANGFEFDGHRSRSRICSASRSAL